MVKGGDIIIGGEYIWTKPPQKSRKDPKKLRVKALKVMDTGRGPGGLTFTGPGLVRKAGLGEEDYWVLVEIRQGERIGETDQALARDLDPQTQDGMTS